MKIVIQNSLGRFLPVSLIVLLASCSPGAPSDDLSKELQATASWAATVHKTAELWTAGIVPTAYASHTLLVAEQAFRDDAGKFQSMPLNEEVRARVLEATISLETEARTISDNIRREDRSSLGEAIARLEEKERAITSMINDGARR